MTDWLNRLGLGPTPADAWRQIVGRRDFERREDERLNVASDIRVLGESAVLVDISNRGCRVLGELELTPGGKVSIEISEPAEVMGEPLRLGGEVVRTSGDRGLDGRPIYTAAILFDEDLPSDSRRRLTALLNAWTTGPGSLVSGSADAALPAIESREFPGLTLDDETDPAVVANVEVHVEHSGTVSSIERRLQRRGLYGGHVVAVADHGSRVLLGRDLSAGGMRVEGLPDLEIGARFHMEIYGPETSDPLTVYAEVMRDDGEEGVALHFVDIDEDAERALGKIVALLPGVD